MVINKRDRKRKPARSRSYLTPNKVLLVVCEGKVTEPLYIRGYEKLIRNSTVQIKISKEHGVPLTLIKVAKRLKKEAHQKAKKSDDSFIDYDEVWCVFDVDDHPNLKDANKLAKDNGIKLAISNPCFELWLLLHFRENPGAQHRDKISEMLKRFLPEYDKHLDFNIFEDKVNNAIIRAEHIDKEAEKMGEIILNPSTGVYKLLKSISTKVILLFILHGNINGSLGALIF